MRNPVLVFSVFFTPFLFPVSAFAGMPFFSLTDVARFRVSTISLFLIIYLLTSFGIYKIWNLLGKDFSRLPKISFKRALTLVFIWGMAFHLVLVMISGTRELMTPGSWEKTGTVYKLSADSMPHMMEARRLKLENLKKILWQYAETHKGNFPGNQKDASIPMTSWLDASGQFTYIYNSELSFDSSTILPLAYEPDGYGEERFVLLTNGQVELLPLERIFSLKEGK